MSIIAFRRTGFGPAIKVAAVPCLDRPGVDLTLTDRDQDADEYAVFDARCQQVVAMRLANAATNTVFAQLRHTPKRRRLLCA